MCVCVLCFALLALLACLPLVRSLFSPCKSFGLVLLGSALPSYVSPHLNPHPLSLRDLPYTHPHNLPSLSHSLSLRNPHIHTLSLSHTHTHARQLGVPATDAVTLSANQSRLLQLEEKYLLPFLKRPTEFSSHARSHSSAGAGAGHAAGGGGGGGKDANDASNVLGVSRYSLDDDEVPTSLALQQAGGGGSVIYNDHIDEIFGYDRSTSGSMTGARLTDAPNSSSAPANAV